MCLKILRPFCLREILSGDKLDGKQKILRYLPWSEKSLTNSLRVSSVELTVKVELKKNTMVF